MWPLDAAWSFQKMAGNEHCYTVAWLNSAIFFCLFLTPLGGFMLIRAVNANRGENEAALTLKHALTQPGAQLGWRFRGGPVATLIGKRYRPRPLSGIHGPLFLRSSSSSLILVTVLGACGLFIWPEYFLSHPTPHGLPIRLLRNEYLTQPITTIQPLLIQVRSDHGIAVNRQAVSPGNFDERLRRELALRSPNWPVYVEGDPNLQWMDIVRLIDAVQAHGRNVFLLKSGNR
jgi:biopolymer transport protein ExbD